MKTTIILMSLFVISCNDQNTFDLYLTSFNKQDQKAIRNMHDEFDLYLTREFGNSEDLGYRLFLENVSTIEGNMEFDYLSKNDVYDFSKAVSRVGGMSSTYLKANMTYIELEPKYNEYMNSYIQSYDYTGEINPVVFVDNLLDSEYDLGSAKIIQHHILVEIVLPIMEGSECVK